MAIKTENFDPNGDFILSVCMVFHPDECETDDDRLSPQDIRVCSATLRQSSPEAEALLNGSSLEKKPDTANRDDPWIIRLQDSEDDLHVFKVMVPIMHGHFYVPDQLYRRQPKTFLSDVLKILLIANKYGWKKYHLLWVKEWMTVAVKVREDINGRPWNIHEKSLFTHLAWFSGDTDLLGRMLKVWMDTTVVDSDGDFVPDVRKESTSEEEKVGDLLKLLPAPFIGTSTTRRWRNIQKLLIFYDQELIKDECGMVGTLYPGRVHIYYQRRRQFLERIARSRGLDQSLSLPMHILVQRVSYDSLIKAIEGMVEGTASGNSPFFHMDYYRDLVSDYERMKKILDYKYLPGRVKRSLKKRRRELGLLSGG
ncbi:hypothetical protein QBC38DRAFT_459408 [Podospora fimiseda]|uniref:Uncharacterized protein n=1 Tax=Podospora fimiseda TaxID=252190 RepID=A0AAN7BHN5_9PEZI|nr:hypothetical protein QBC38DRAFT_459408 [Podospora fimiseda]